MRPVSMGARSDTGPGQITTGRQRPKRSKRVTVSFLCVIMMRPPYEWANGVGAVYATVAQNGTVEFLTPCELWLFNSHAADIQSKRHVSYGKRAEIFAIYAA